MQKDTTTVLKRQVTLVGEAVKAGSIDEGENEEWEFALVRTAPAQRDDARVV